MAANDKAAGRVASVMQENRLFPPPQEFSGRSRIGSMEAYQALYDEAANNPASFWAERAQSLPWCIEPGTVGCVGQLVRTISYH